MNELRELKQNNTWVLVPRSLDINVVCSKWVHKIELKSDGSIE